METNDLKSIWKESGTSRKSESSLAPMTKIANHPTLKKVRRKLIIEAILLGMVLIIYYDWFDGDLKPLYMNILFGTSLVLFILNDIAGYWMLKNPVRDDNIKLSLQKQIHILKRISILSMLSAIVYGITLLMFLTATIEFTTKKYIMLGGLILVFIVMYYLLYRSWKNKNDAFKKTVADFDE